MESKTALKNQGFTLIELLISLLVISILVSLGYANFRKYAQKQALWAVARQIEGDLRLAQSYAMSGKDASSCSSSGYLYGYKLAKESNSSYSIKLVCRDPNTSLISDLNMTIPFLRNIPTGFEFEFSPSNNVIFKAVTGGVDSATSINIRRSSTTSPYILITVSLTGTISLSYNE